MEVFNTDGHTNAPPSLHLLFLALSIHPPPSLAIFSPPFLSPHPSLSNSFLLFLFRSLNFLFYVFFPLFLLSSYLSLLFSFHPFNSLSSSSFFLPPIHFLSPHSPSFPPSIHPPSQTSKQDLIGRRSGGPDLDRQEVSVIAAGHI